MKMQQKQIEFAGGALMIDEIFNTFLLDGEMTAIMSGLLVIFTAFNVFLLHRIGGKRFAVCVGIVLALILICFAVFAISADFGIGIITMWASFVLLPLLVSQAFAFSVLKIFKAGKEAKIIGAAAAVALIACACIFWPKPIEEKIGEPIIPDSFYYYDDGIFTERTVSDKSHLATVVSQINCMPCFFTPDFSEDCIVMKLNENYVLLALRNESSYIFEHSGKTEDFVPQKACLKVYRNDPLYINIKTS